MLIFLVVWCLLCMYMVEVGLLLISIMVRFGWLLLVVMWVLMCIFRLLSRFLVIWWLLRMWVGCGVVELVIGG